MHVWLMAVALAALPKVSVVVEEERSSWQPIEPDDVAQAMGQAALEAFTKEAQAALERVPSRAQATGDYVLLVSGRMLDESESHVVYVSIESAKKTDLASVRSADTIVIGKMERAKMLSLIEASARKAAQKVGVAAKKSLQQVANDALPEPVSSDTPLPWTWAVFKEPSPDAGRAAQEVMLDDHDKSHAALRELTSLAFVDANMRRPLGHCALEHKNTDMRRDCLIAMRPLVFQSNDAQRIVIEVYRRDKEGKVREAASDIMAYFSGLARNDAIQAWLDQAAQGNVSGPLHELGDLPNIDTVAAKCIVAMGKRPKYQRSKSACLSLLEPLSATRRWAVLSKPLAELDPDSPIYLEGAGTSEGSTGTDFQTAWTLVLDGAPQFWPGFEDVLWKRYERTLSSSALDALSDNAPLTRKLVDRMVEVIQTAGRREGVAGLKRIMKADPKLRAVIKEKLAELLATNAFHKDVQARTLEDMMKDIERMEAKGL